MMTGRETIVLAVVLMLSATSAVAQSLPQGLTFEQEEDTLVIRRPKREVNDYTTIGFEYGVTRNAMMFNPDFKQSPFITPGYYGVTFTKNCRMMNMFPYFALQVGLFYGQEGYRFKENEETGYIYTQENATQAIMKTVEVPVLAQFHADMTHFKAYLLAGPYAGYRLNIDRVDQNPADEFKNAFTDYEKRFEYGLHGGVGFSLIFAPVEFNVTLRTRYGLSNIWQPDYYSQYYYRFGHPFDFMLTAGISFQLTKRYGKTKAMLKKEAYKAVYEPEDTTK